MNIYTYLFYLFIYDGSKETVKEGCFLLHLYDEVAQTKSEIQVYKILTS